MTMIYPGVAPRSRRFGPALITCALMFGLCPLAARPDEPDGAVLRLVGGGTAAGHLVSSDRPEILAWQADAFVEPFGFQVEAVDSIQWPPTQPPPRPNGDFRFELHGGDTLFGTLVNLDGQSAELQIPQLGRVRVERDAIRRIDRWGGGSNLVYLGPTGLAGWTPTPNAEAWRDAGGTPTTDKPGAAIKAELGLPAQAAIEFELSWEKRGDFVLILGTGSDDRSTRRAFRLEVWGAALVAVRETESDVDLAEIGTIPAGPGRLTLRLFLDQEAGRLLVHSAEGRELADLKVPARNPLPGPGVELRNVQGDVRLDRLQIAQWDGTLPRPASAGGQLVKRDGSIAEGTVVRLDTEKQEIILRANDTNDEATRVPLDQVAGLTLATASRPPVGGLSLLYQDGTRISGRLLSVGDDTFRLERTGFDSTLELPRAGLRSLSLSNPAPAPAPDTPVSSSGEQATNVAETPPADKVRLELEGVWLPGQLADAASAPGTSCLAWKPVGSTNSSALKPGLAGRVLFREPPEQIPSEASIQQRRQAMIMARAQRVQRGGALGVLDRFRNSLAAARATPTASTGPTLYLRDGDTIPCEVTSIDEQGVHFRSPMTESTFVAHAKIKALDMQPLNPRVLVGKSKRERLLTLPRMQRDNPPTHLIRSREGDTIRGRLLSMDDAKLQFELRLDTREVDRKLIAYIIWLHADELTPAKSTEEPASTPQPDPQTLGTRVQTVRNDGTRLTFMAERFADGALAGVSDVLGPCRVAITGVDRITFGSAIAEEAATLSAQRWKLAHAPEPRFVNAGDEGGGSAGTESTLVGQPAPDFSLELLEGGKFQLAKEKGHIVVLDFWATWCGPCIQAMPQVERVAEEFKDRGVRLIAVNLQESPDEIRAMLERHQLDPEVVLDIDGAVAQKYAADAIPQTVIIDAEGKIARLFVGGGSKLEDQLREAIGALLTDKNAAAPTTR